MIFLIRISCELTWVDTGDAGIRTVIPAAVKVYMSEICYIIWDVNRILIATA